MTFHYCFNLYVFGFQDLASLHMSSGEGNGTPLQYSCLENPMGRGAWWAAELGMTE